MIASHQSSIREPDLDFTKLVDELEHADITIKQEETENLKLNYVNNTQTTTSQIIHIHDSDTELAEKIIQTSNIYEENTNFKGKPSFKKWCNYCRRYDHSIAECRKKHQDNQNKPQKRREPNKFFHQYMKKDQSLPNKNILSNISSGKELPVNYNSSSQQSPYKSIYRRRSPIERNSQKISQNIYSRSNSQSNQYRNNYSRSNSKGNNYSGFVKNSSHSNSHNRYYSNDRTRNFLYDRRKNFTTRFKKENFNKEKPHDFEINQEKITKPSFHNLKDIFLLFVILLTILTSQIMTIWKCRKKAISIFALETIPFKHFHRRILQST